MDAAARQQAASLWVAAMRRGDWETAWRQTDLLEQDRRNAPGKRAPHHLLWDGTPFDGRSVLVRCDHGLGDTLQFIRFVPRVAAVARELTLLVQPQLLDLLAGAPGLGEVRNAWVDGPWPPHEVAVEIMELAYAFRVAPATLPPPYPHLVQRVRGRLPCPLPQDSRLRVGLVWAASDWDATRSVPLAVLQPLLRMDGVRFFSLQQGAAADGAAAWGIEPLSRLTADLAAAGAAMLELDLVISVDAMPAHLAATLGRPTWLLLKHEADWRWMVTRGDSPWYPSMRLFRQPHPGDWDSAVAGMALALRGITAASGPAPARHS